MSPGNVWDKLAHYVSVNNNTVLSHMWWRETTIKGEKVPEYYLMNGMLSHFIAFL